MIKQLPLNFEGAHKSDVRTQFAALCYRQKAGGLQILLVTSRGSGRWIVPKGWPMSGKTPYESAVQEAWEEGGVVGRAHARPLGLFAYTKGTDDDDLPCVAMVYAVKVKSLSSKFPEAGERKRRWVSQKKAASMVDEPELARILRDFDPRKLD